jgi:hypothetical protein
MKASRFFTSKNSIDTRSESPPFHFTKTAGLLLEMKSGKEAGLHRRYEWQTVNIDLEWWTMLLLFGIATI